MTIRTGCKTGEIEYSYGAEYLQNYGSYYKVYKKAMDYTKEHNADQEIVFVDLFKVFKIDYEDIYNERHEVYFINGNLATHGDVEMINRNVEANFPNERFKIDIINFDEVLRKIVDGGSQSGQS